MTGNTTITSDQLKRAVETIKNLRPAYKSLLDFYEKIFIAQGNSKDRIHIDPVKIPEEVLSIKAKEKFSLISISEFVIDTKASEELFKNICKIAEAVDGDISVAAKKINSAIDAKKLDIDNLFPSLLNEEEDFFEKVSKDLEIDKKILSFITYNSIKPSLSLCAQQLSTYLDKNTVWGKGYCPICGSPPVLSLFQDQGQRFLSCGFCWHKWPSRRIYCPFCENEDSGTIHYFASEEEEEYRVDVCDNCKKYIKTVDTRKTSRIIYPPLEHFATLHLDIKAKEMGYESGIQLDLKE